MTDKDNTIEPLDAYQDIVVVDENGIERPAPFGPTLDEVLSETSQLKDKVADSIRAPSVQRGKKRKIRPPFPTEIGYEPKAGLSNQS